MTTNPEHPARYGITYSDDETSICQTGYDYDTVQDALVAARTLIADGSYGDLDTMCVDDETRPPVYAVIESTADEYPDTHATLVLATGEISYWYEGADRA